MGKVKTKLGQIEIEFRTWGGKRRGAGRKRRGRTRVSHRRREDFHRSSPSHITLRFVDGLPTMRRRKAFQAIRQAMFVVLPRTDFRIVHLTIQSNHCHLIVEASGRAALASGMRAFKISAARRLNNVLGRSGTTFDDRYHQEVLETPTQVRNALCYCLNNWRRHGEDRGASVRVDVFSTGVFFHGWRERGPLEGLPPGDDYLPSATAQTWLIREGWTKAGPPLSLYDRPGPRPTSRA